MISSVSVSPVEYWYSIPAVYLSGYGGYGYTANYTWAALTVTAASGTTWVPGSGSASGTTQNFGSTTSFAGESADQTYTFTIADAGIDALLRWNWYTTITYSVPQNDPPVAEFSASNTTPYFNELVTLSDLSTNAPSGWQWTFSPSTVTYTSGSSTSQSPTIRFDASGTYDVSLNAQNAYGDDDEIKVGHITVSPNLIIPSSGSSTVTTCSGNLYDSEGSSSNYATSSDGYITIYPSTPGSKVNITGTITTESGYDLFMFMTEKIHPQQI